MKPISGLNRDVNPIDQPKDTMRYAANGIISESTGLAQNIRTELEWEAYGANDYTFLGQALGKNFIYHFLYNLIDSIGEIWRFDPDIPGSKLPIIIDPSNILEFDQEAASGKILQIVYQQDFDDHEIFAWAGESKPRIIDIGQVIEDNGNVLPADLDVIGYTASEFMLFPEGQLFNPDAVAINSGGSVASGAWMWVYRYVYPDESVTSFSGVGNSVYITEDGFNLQQTFKGDAGGRPTTKSIDITFPWDGGQRVDTIRVQFGYISIRDGVIFAGILDSKGLSGMIINNNDAVYTYTGEDPLIDLGDNILELITPKAIYSKIGTITSLTSRLYAGCLTTQAELNIQNIANGITSKWTVGIDNYINKGGLLNNNTFGAGEIYALYISILYRNGTESRAFHIPGRKWKDEIIAVQSTGTVQIVGNATGDGDVGFVIDGIVNYLITPVAPVTATGTFTVAGNAAGDGIVGMTYNGTPYNMTPVAADTPTIMAAALVILINGGGELTAIAAAGVITLTHTVPGSAANLPVTDNTTDTTTTGTPVGLAGGSEDTPATMGVALLAQILLDITVTAVHDGAGLLTLTYVIPGVIGNNVLLEFSTDSTVTTTRVGMAGGVDGQLSDDIPVAIDGRIKWTIFDTTTPAGDVGYWANQNEFYPNLPEFDTAKDPGSPYADNVRHHKMPSLGYLVDNGHLTVMNNAPKLSIVLENIDLTALGPEVAGYNIHYAKRKIGEFVNLSYECPTPVGEFPGGGESRVAIAGGFAYGDGLLTDVGDPLLDVVPEVIKVTMLRFHSLFLLDDNPAINPIYLVKEFESIAAQVKDGLIVNSDLYTDIAGLENQFLPSAYKYGFIDGVFAPPSAGFAGYDEINKYVNINDYAYVRNGVKWGFLSSSIDNNAGEDAFIVYTDAANGFNGDQVNVPVKPAVIGGLTTRFNHLATTVFTLCALRTVPENVSTPFDNQVLNFAGSFPRVDGSSEVATIDGKHGDRFNSMMQFNTTGVAGMGTDAVTPANRAVIDTTTDEAGMLKGEGSKIIYSGPSQSPINHAAQDYDPGDTQSFLAKIGGSVGADMGVATLSLIYDQVSIVLLKTWYFTDMDIYRSMTYVYNDDFHRKSEYFIRGINDGYFNDSNTFPFTIAFSLQQAVDQNLRQWRNWLIDNKYVQPSEKGKIINLKGAGNQMLYIHHRYSLYTTKDRISMQTDSVSVIIGSSDIFQVTPYEMVSVDEGHTGLKNRNWHSLSPFGYSWMQTDHGKVYMHDGKSLEEMSGVGMRTYFREYLFDNGNVDEACYIVNDDLRRRIIVGFGHLRADLALGTTFAFSTTGQFWSFFQDMDVVYPIIARDKRVFMWGKGVEENSIYSVAEGAYDNNARPFIVEVVMNDGTSAHKYLQFLKWNTNVFSNNLDVDDQTFNKLVMYSDSKIYGTPGAGPPYWDVNLIPYTGFPRGNQNLRRLEDNWSTNNFRDLWDGATNILPNAVDNNGPNSAAINTGLTWDKKGRVRDKYLLIRLYYDIANDNKFEFENIEFGIKPSFR